MAMHDWPSAAASFRQAEERLRPTNTYAADMLMEATDAYEAVCMTAERCRDLLIRAVYGWPQRCAPAPTTTETQE